MGILVSVPDLGPEVRYLVLSFFSERVLDGLLHRLAFLPGYTGKVLPRRGTMLSQLPHEIHAVFREGLTVNVAFTALAPRLCAGPCRLSVLAARGISDPLSPGPTIV